MHKAVSRECGGGFDATETRAVKTSVFPPVFLAPPPSPIFHPSTASRELFSRQRVSRSRQTRAADQISAPPARGWERPPCANRHRDRITPLASSRNGPGKLPRWSSERFAARGGNDGRAPARSTGLVRRPSLWPLFEFWAAGRRSNRTYHASTAPRRKKI